MDTLQEAEWLKDSWLKDSWLKDSWLKDSGMDENHAKAVVRVIARLSPDRLTTRTS